VGAALTSGERFAHRCGKAGEAEELARTTARDRRGFAATAAAVTFLLLSGCSWGTPPAVRPPRPDRLLVAPFAVAPRELAADRATGERGERLKAAAARTTEQERVGTYFARALQADLVEALRGLGLPAVAGTAPARATGRLAWIDGELLSVAAGQPEVVGFEAGRPDVVAATGLYAVGVSGPLNHVELALGGAAGSVPAELLPPAIPAAGGGTGELGPDERARLDQGARQAAALLARRFDPSFRLLGWLPGGLVTLPEPLGGLQPAPGDVSGAAGAGPQL
jgi:hypothetical protein